VSNLNDTAVNRDEARHLWRLGRFKDLETKLSGRYEVWALIERGRLAFFHNSDVETAYDFLNAAFAGSVSSDDRILSASLLDVVLASMGRAEFNRYSALEFYVSAPQVAAEAVYFFASAAYMRQDYAKARQLLASHSPLLPVLIARYALLEGFLCAAADQDFMRQASLTEKALAILQTQAPDERYFIASCAETLAHLVRELRFSTGLAYLQGLVSTIWEDGFQEAQFQVLRTVAWMYALDAHYGAALCLLERASLASTTNLMRAFVQLDCASVAVFAGSSVHAKASFEIADNYIRGIKHNSGRSHAVILPLGAQVAAEVGECKRAIEYCEMAEGAKSQIARHYNLAHGPRYEAMISEAKALAYASEDRKNAIKHAKAAYGVFSPIGYGWRAGRMALFLYQMTRKAVWRGRALEHLSAYPDSPFYRMLSVGTTRRTLTPTQQQVLTLLARGYRTKRIAAELNRASTTVCTHIRRIHAAFGVNSRQELLAKLAAEGQRLGA
jgi:DNA-binding CsgD family transcriptional regulator